MSLLNKTVELRIIDPKKERPGIIRRFLDHGKGGGFIWFTMVYLIAFSFRKIFNFFRKPKLVHKLSFDAWYLTIQEGGQKKQLKLKDLKEFRIDYNSESFNHEYDYTKFPKIRFIWNGVEHCYYFISSGFTVNKLFRLLYSNKVIVKEFRNEKRMFLGKKPKYAEIQEIKKTYGVEW